MLSLVLLFCTIVGKSVEDVVKKVYNNRVGGKGVFFFSTMSTAFAAMFYVCSAGASFRLNPQIFPYVFAFTATYATALVTSLLAVREGSLALSSLAISYSMVIPTFYGLIFKKEPATIWLYLGILLLLISLVLINRKEGDTKITLKWIVYALFAFISNGMCTVVMVVQQEDFEASYKNEFMMISLLMVTVVLLLIAICTERKEIMTCVKKGSVWAIMNGTSNGVRNLFTLMLTGMMASSVMFPLSAAGGIILTSFISGFVYRERLSFCQKAGLVLGIAAVVFLNL